MKVLELFAGERCISKAFEAKGHETFTVEWDKSHEGISLYADVSVAIPLHVPVVLLFIVNEYG